MGSENLRRTFYERAQLSLPDLHLQAAKGQLNFIDASGQNEGDGYNEILG